MSLAMRLGRLTLSTARMHCMDITELSDQWIRKPPRSSCRRQNAPQSDQRSASNRDDGIELARHVYEWRRVILYFLHSPFGPHREHRSTCSWSTDERPAAAAAATSSSWSSLSALRVEDCRERVEHLVVDGDVVVIPAPFNMLTLFHAPATSPRHLRRVSPAQTVLWFKRYSS